MDKPLIVYIETATNTCSVALSEGEDVIGIKESHEERSHAAQLSPFIKEVLSASGKTFSDLDAVCVSIGPGSYTGLRIGISTAKGLAFGLDIPVIAVDTLEALTMTARPLISRDSDKHELPALFCPMLDARRMEVYSALYDSNMRLMREVKAEIIDPESFADLLKNNCIYFFGNGAAKCSEVIKHPNAFFYDDIHPSARGLVTAALRAFRNKRFEDTAYFEPRYLKEFIATTPKNKVL